jgi:hypothetical protein
MKPSTWRPWRLTQELIGKPDLVISDYEPISAQYAYASGTPLVTIDQQSKYLVGDYEPRASLARPAWMK